MATLEGWLEIMYQGIDAVGVDMQPNRDQDRHWRYRLALPPVSTVDRSATSLNTQVRLAETFWEFRKHRARGRRGMETRGTESERLRPAGDQSDCFCAAVPRNCTGATV
eukprot:1195764-Prorocentrum_minimum.AAC.5